MGRPFYGLILSPNDKLRICKEVFSLCYYGHGFNHDEVYSMPISRRYFFLKMLTDTKKEEQEVTKSQQAKTAKTIAKAPPVRSR